MTAMTGIAAAPLAAVVPISKSSAFAADRSKWERAVRHLRALEADFAKLDPVHTEAFDAAEAACPYRREFFRHYRLGCHSEGNRDKAFKQARWVIVNERVQAVRRALIPEEAKQATADAHRVADDFDSWCRARDEAHKLHHCNELEDELNALFVRLSDAKHAVLETEAPDEAALLLKFKILAEIMEGDEDLPRVERLQADAKRLFAIH